MREEFTFSQEVRDTAKDRLQEAVRLWQDKNVNLTTKEVAGAVGGMARDTAAMKGAVNGTAVPLVVVGVHVRRTDYTTFFKKRTGGSVPGVPYFERAFDYFRKK